MHVRLEKTYINTSQVFYQSNYFHCINVEVNKYNPEKILTSY